MDTEVGTADFAHSQLLLLIRARWHRVLEILLKERDDSDHRADKPSLCMPIHRGRPQLLRARRPPGGTVAGLEALLSVARERVKSQSRGTPRIEPAVLRCSI